ERPPHGTGAGRCPRTSGRRAATRPGTNPRAHHAFRSSPAAASLAPPQITDNGAAGRREAVGLANPESRILGFRVQICETQVTTRVGSFAISVHYPILPS